MGDKWCTRMALWLSVAGAGRGDMGWGECVRCDTLLEGGMFSGMLKNALGGNGDVLVRAWMAGVGEVLEQDPDPRRLGPVLDDGEELRSSSNETLLV
jgi:hypothetical protein